MAPSNEEGPSCLICGGETNDYMPAPGHGTMRRCLSCGFVFADPMSLSPEPTELFTRAYSGTEDRAAMRDFHMRMLVQDDARRAKVSAQRMLSAASRKALTFLKSSVSAGSTVLDIGCGVGYFLDAVDTSGYKAAGLDVAKPVVAVVEKKGYPAWHGTIDTVPHGWIEPQVCTSFFSLHHMPDPVGFLATVRGKFPEAMLIVAEYNYEYLMAAKRMRPHEVSRNLPPRCYSWWEARHLRLAMEKAGYEVQTVLLDAQPRDVGMGIAPGGFLALRRHLPFLFPWLTGLYYRAVPWVGRPWTVCFRLRWGRARGQVLAIGHPA